MFRQITKKILEKRLDELVPFFVTFLIHEKKHKEQVPFHIKLNMWRKGFFGRSYYLYNLTQNDHKKYLSNYQRIKTKRINGKYSFLLDNKLCFYKAFSKDLAIPKNYCLINKGCFIELDNKKTKSIEDLIALLKNEKYLMFKPVDESAGKGVLKVYSNNNNYYLNDKKIPLKELTCVVKSLNNYLCCQYIKQDGYAKKIFPESVNTIRIVSFAPYYLSKPFIGLAIHRFGTINSKPTDNWSRGGVSALIDSKSGEIQKVACYRHPTVVWMDKHPDTNMKIYGIKIPNWNKIKADIIAVHAKFRFTPYIGWDIAALRNGFYVLEANNHTGVDVLQLHRPLLLNQKVKEFYQNYGII